MSRRVTLKLGFAGNTRDVTVVIPDDEPMPWQWGERLSVVGKPTARVDGPLKATGAARYTYDIELPGMLYGAILRCPRLSISMACAQFLLLKIAKSVSRARKSQLLPLSVPIWPTTRSS